MTLCECGRPAIAFPAKGKKRSRSARARIPKAVKHHTMCLACWMRQNDRLRKKPARAAVEVVQ